MSQNIFRPYGAPDYSSYEDMYGLPYLKSVVIYMHVLEHIRAAAVFG